MPMNTTDHFEPFSAAIRGLFGAKGRVCSPANVDGYWRVLRDFDLIAVQRAADELARTPGPLPEAASVAAHIRGRTTSDVSGHDTSTRPHHYLRPGYACCARCGRRRENVQQDETCPPNNRKLRPEPPRPAPPAKDANEDHRDIERRRQWFRDRANLVKPGSAWEPGTYDFSAHEFDPDAELDAVADKFGGVR